EPRLVGGSMSGMPKMHFGGGDELILSGQRNQKPFHEEMSQIFGEPMYPSLSGFGSLNKQLKKSGSWEPEMSPMSMSPLLMHLHEFNPELDFLKSIGSGKKSEPEESEGNKDDPDKVMPENVKKDKGKWILSMPNIGGMPALSAEIADFKLDVEKKSKLRVI